MQRLNQFVVCCYFSFEYNLFWFFFSWINFCRIVVFNWSYNKICLSCSLHIRSVSPSSHSTWFSSGFENFFCQDFCIAVLYLWLLVSPFWSPANSTVGRAAGHWITSWTNALLHYVTCTKGSAGLKFFEQINIHVGDFCFFLTSGY